ncbi:sulfatase-like hydrolase/transferase [Gynuella sp.]|uniref:sulfatase-like hydrolase/transferase n=1 Tax=Gynuella sp. TaxID=2969146 RepID=UPI003D12428F
MNSKVRTLDLVLSSFICCLFVFFSYVIGWRNISFPVRGEYILSSRYWNLALVRDILYFFLAHLFIIVVIGSVIFFVAIYFRIYIKQKFNAAVSLSFTTFVVVLLIHLMLFGYCVEHYPHLEVSVLLGGLESLKKYVLLGHISLIILLFITCISFLVSYRRKENFIKSILFLFFLIIFFLPYAGYISAGSFSSNSDSNIKETTVKPNVVFIGIDSLSSVHIDNYGENLPNITSFINSSWYSPQVFTPIARTFPAWSSILSGKYPSKTGARFNLTDFDRVKTDGMLQNLLKQQGYYTIFAQDERRFNNIDELFGFDKSIGPKVGVSDFIIPMFSDNPYSAYFLDSAIGKWLFPNIAFNRVSSITYKPEKFVKEVLGQVGKREKNTPLFLAVHFCLAHYPYSWANAALNIPSSRNIENYFHLAAAQRVDEQVGHFLQGLKQSGVLQNAIVVLLSDHGEGIGFEPPVWSDGFWDNKGRSNIYFEMAAKAQKYRDPTSFARFLRGHGNSLLSIEQVKSILSIHQYGGYFNDIPKHNNFPVSLVDVAPTIMDLLHMPQLTDADGISLMKTDDEFNKRPIFMETGLQMKLPSIGGGVQEISGSIKDKMLYYHINKDGKLVISNDFFKEQIKEKQFGVVMNDWLIISEKSKFSDDMKYLVVNRKNGFWSTNLNEPLLPKLVLDMKNALDAYIGL